MEPKLRSAILIISDTTPEGSASGFTAKDSSFILSEHEIWDPPSIRIIPDNLNRIRNAVCACTDSLNAFDLVLISDNREIAVNNNVFEAVSPLLDRRIPDLELPRYYTTAGSLKATRSSLVANPITGIRSGSLIITSPGPLKSVEEGLKGVLRHLSLACTQNIGVRLDSILKLRNVTSAMAAAKPSQNCSKKPAICKDLITDINLPSEFRPSSPTTSVVSIEEAVYLISNKTPSPRIHDSQVTPFASGCVIAEDVYAASMVPKCRISAVDGYALVLENGAPLKCTFPRTSVINQDAREGLHPIQPGQIFRITKGAPLPPNGNAVVRMEDTYLGGQDDDEVKILVNDTVPGSNVIEPGSEIRLNSQILACGDLISPTSGELTLLAASGIRNVKLFKKPRVGVLSLGDSNPLQLLSCLMSWGFETVDLGRTRQTMADGLENALRNCICASSSPPPDVILLTNGTSTGDLNLKSTVENRLAGSVHFDNVSIKPGSNTVFATIPVNAPKSSSHEQASIVLFSLEDDHVSQLVTLSLLVLPSLQKLIGLHESRHDITGKSWISPQVGLPRVAVVLTHHFPLDPKFTEYRRVIVTGSRSDARLYASSIGAEDAGQRGLRVGSIKKANGLVVLRAGRGVGIRGEIVEALMIGPVYDSDTRLTC